MNNLKTTNLLLMIIAIPIVFYILHLLSFIFIPLIFSMFFALLFLPLTRGLRKRKVPNIISIIIVLSIIALAIKVAVILIQLSTKQILSANNLFLHEAELKLSQLIFLGEDFLGIKRIENISILSYYAEKTQIVNKLGNSFDFIRDTISMTLMTIFFTVLWLAESINFQKVLNHTILKQKTASIKTFIKIENDLIKFMKVKFIISFFTGVGIGLACYFFDVSFPIFWGLFAFAINFVQMIGSIISVVLTALFSIVELDPSGSLLVFILIITGVQVLFGGILEPIFMGKSFSMNIITILVMLMLWGFIWGIPGLIMAIPITVFLKILFEQFPETLAIAELMSGSENNRKLRKK